MSAFVTYRWLSSDEQCSNVRIIRYGVTRSRPCPLYAKVRQTCKLQSTSDVMKSVKKLVVYDEISCNTLCVDMNLTVQRHKEFRL